MDFFLIIGNHLIKGSLMGFLIYLLSPVVGVWTGERVGVRGTLISSPLPLIFLKTRAGTLQREPSGILF
jgi:hypothetical protein